MTKDQQFINLATKKKRFKELEPFFLALDDTQKKTVWLNLIFRNKNLTNYEDIFSLYKQHTFFKDRPEEIFENYINLDVRDGSNSKHIAWYIQHFNNDWLLRPENKYSERLHRLLLEQNNDKFIYGKAAKAYFTAINKLDDKTQKEILAYNFQHCEDKNHYVKLIFQYASENMINFAIEHFYSSTSNKKDLAKVLLIHQPNFDFLSIKDILLSSLTDIVACDDFIVQTIDLGANFSINKLHFIVTHYDDLDQKRAKPFLNNFINKIHHFNLEKVEEFLNYRIEHTDVLDKNMLLKFIYKIAHSAPKPTQNKLLHAIFTHVNTTDENVWLREKLFSSDEMFYVEGFEQPIKPANLVLQATLKNYLQFSLEKDLSNDKQTIRKNKL